MKPTILNAAIRVAARDGLDRLTMDAVAAEANVSKGGLLYHFASKDEMLDGIFAYLITEMESRLLDALGIPLEQSTSRQRLAAYLQVAMSGGINSLELAIGLANFTDSNLARHWDDMMTRWVPAPATPDQPVDIFLALMAIDGLWLYDATTTHPLPTDVREALITRIGVLAGLEHSDT